MGTYEKYSFLMSVYNKETPENLRASIESMLFQTVLPDQIVIVEDGIINDKLKEVVDDFVQKNNIFTIVQLDKNYGLGKALDIGINYCRNDLVARMDSDDISLAERCEKQLAIFRDMPDMSIISGNIDEFIGSPKNIVSSRIVPEKQEDIVKRMRTRSAFNHPAVMYRKSEVLRCGGYGKLKRKQDHDLFSRMMNSGCNAYNIQEPILLFRADGNNLRRRKSWVNCSSYIIAQWHILCRGHCFVRDFIFVLAAQMFFLFAPNSIVKYISDNLLRKTNREKKYG